MKIAVMTDSTAYIPSELREQHHIHMVPLSVVFDDVSYREEIDLTTEEFYQKMKESDELPTTSQPAVGDIVAKLEELANDYDAVISIHLSARISGTHQAVESVGEMMKDDIKVYALDSELSALPQGLLALSAAEMAKQDYTPEEIMEHLTEMKDRIRAYFMVDDLTNLHRGGRLSNAQALIGSLLQIKPILHFVDGVIVPFEKIRTRKKAILRIQEMLEEDIKKDKVAKIVFIHGNDEQAALDLKEQIAKKHPDIESMIGYFGPVIGTHLGEKSLGISWYPKL